MQRVMIFVFLLFVAASGRQAHAEQENRGSANYMLPLCKTWLNVAVEKDRQALRQILVDDPFRLVTGGMCAGVVVGIEETLRTFELACPPDGVTNEQLVRMVVSRSRCGRFVAKSRKIGLICCFRFRSPPFRCPSPHTRSKSGDRNLKYSRKI
jgi:hypothetical protein